MHALKKTGESAPNQPHHITVLLVCTADAAYLDKSHCLHVPCKLAPHVHCKIAILHVHRSSDAKTKKLVLASSLQGQDRDLLARRLSNAAAVSSNPSVSQAAPALEGAPSRAASQQLQWQPLGPAPSRPSLDSLQQVSAGQPWPNMHSQQQPYAQAPAAQARSSQDTPRQAASAQNPWDTAQATLQRVATQDAGNAGLRQPGVSTGQSYARPLQHQSSGLDYQTLGQRQGQLQSQQRQYSGAGYLQQHQAVGLGHLQQPWGSGPGQLQQPQSTYGQPQRRRQKSSVDDAAVQIPGLPEPQKGAPVQQTSRRVSKLQSAASGNVGQRTTGCISCQQCMLSFPALHKWHGLQHAAWQCCCPPQAAWLYNSMHSRAMHAP